MSVLLRNKKGNAILQVLAAIIVMGISFYFLSSYVIAQKKQIVKTKNVVNLKFAVNSAMDYVVFGIRQKYCFDNNTLLQNIDACNWNHAGNVERLVMSDEQLQSLKEMVGAGANIGPHDPDLNKLRVDKIDLLLTFPVSPAHPLFSIVDALKTVVNENNGEIIKVKGIRIVLNRPENTGYLPKSGREVYVMAEASLLDSSGDVIQIGRAPLQVRSQITVFPREMGSFGLVLPRDLHLDKEWNASVDSAHSGDVNLHKFANRTSVANSTGLVFYSPVFVNGNIFLPTDSGSAANSNYAAVTFADRVYMGNGWILRPDGNPYAPTTMGGLPDRYWSDSRVFGGFLGGIENDGSSDAGLEVLSGRSNGIQSGSFDLNRLCADYNKKTVDINTMKLSKMKAKSVLDEEDYVDGSTQKSKYQIALTNYNQFYPQKNYMPGANLSQWGNGKVSINNVNKKGDAVNTGAVASIEIAYGRGADYRVVTFDLTKYGSAVLEPEVVSSKRMSDLSDQRSRLQIDLATASGATSGLQSDLNSSKANLSTAKSQLSAKEAELSTELAKPIYTTPTTNPSPSPSPSPTGSPIESPTPEPVESPAPTAEPTTTPTGTPAATPAPTTSPSPSPSSSPTTVDPTQYQNPDTIAKLKQEIDALKVQISTLENHIKDLKDNKIPNNESEITKKTAELSSVTAALADYQQVLDNPPKFLIDMELAKSRSGREYQDRINLNVDLKNAGNLRDSDGNKIENFSVRFKAFDGTYWNSTPVYYDSNSDKHLLGYLNYTIDPSGTIHRPSGLSATSNASGTAEEEGDGSVDLAQMCADFYDNMNSQSFGAANWGVSFSGGTRSSWNFADLTGEKSPKEPGHESEPIVDAKTWDVDDSEFKVHSIVGNCVIEPTTAFVTGFYTCDHLTIKGGRTKPLTIVGTFIIGKSLKIDEQSIRTGIHWYSIYHPQSTRILRKKGILRALSNKADLTKCDKLPSPIWHPIPSIQETADRMSCNVISLRAKADPFKWTAVDPDCGVEPGKTQTVPKCKRRIIRYFVVEQSREGAGF